MASGGTRVERIDFVVGRYGWPQYGWRQWKDTPSESRIDLIMKPEDLAGIKPPSTTIWNVRLNGCSLALRTKDQLLEFGTNVSVEERRLTSKLATVFTELLNSRVHNGLAEMSRVNIHIACLTDVMFFRTASIVQAFLAGWRNSHVYAGGITPAAAFRTSELSVAMAEADAKESAVGIAV